MENVNRHLFLDLVFGGEGLTCVAFWLGQRGIHGNLKKDLRQARVSGFSDWGKKLRLFVP